MERTKLITSPGKLCEPVRYFEQRSGELQTADVVVGQRRRGSLDDRPGQQLRVPKRVGNPMGRDRVLEVAGITYERPSGAGSGPDDTAVTGEPMHLLYLLSGVEPAGELGCGLEK